MGSFFKGGGGTKQDEVEGGVPCVRYGDLYTQHQFFIRHTRASIAEASTGNYRLLRYADVLFAGSGETIEEIGKSAVNLIEGRAFCGGDVIVFRPSIEVDAGFLGYAADCHSSVYQKACMGRGVTVMHIYSSELKHLLIPLPPLEEQRAIADYLDTETARIDTLISKKRRLIELLEESWQSTVRQVMSGASRTSVALKHLCTIKRDQSPRPIDDPGYFADDGSHGWVRIKDVTRGGMYLTETRQRLSDIGRARSVAVGPGMVLVSIAATVGKPTITAMNCCYHDGFVGLHRLRAIPEYVYFFLTLPEVFGGLGQVGTQANINSEIVGQIKIPLPDNSEQQRIVDHLNANFHRMETAKSRLQTQLDLLTERRRGLLAAVVTGEIPVPERQPKSMCAPSKAVA